MSQLKIEWKWKLKGQFHIGAGIGRVGYADSILRKNGTGNYFIPGDAVKGAVREGAERLLHWLLSDRKKDEPSTSFPTTLCWNLFSRRRRKRRFTGLTQADHLRRYRQPCVPHQQPLKTKMVLPMTRRCE